eukprot:TRINITY_DN13305_c0_g1_i1.p1 TRINITY_DN13305_c0_g1~~TRINITY_DN13305_c0_g1_i1.p1  ORF type:complete len:436 (+),score=74.34 TRINITY_DN13305_c0_g1_i1:41-1348(+)
MLRSSCGAVRVGIRHKTNWGTPSAAGNSLKEFAANLFSRGNKETSAAPQRSISSSETDVSPLVKKFQVLNDVIADEGKVEDYESSLVEILRLLGLQITLQHSITAPFLKDTIVRELISEMAEGDTTNDNVYRFLLQLSTTCGQSCHHGVAITIIEKIMKEEYHQDDEARIINCRKRLSLHMNAVGRFADALKQAELVMQDSPSGEICTQAMYSHMMLNQPEQCIETSKLLKRLKPSITVVESAEIIRKKAEAALAKRAKLLETTDPDAKLYVTHDQFLRIEGVSKYQTSHTALETITFVAQLLQSASRKLRRDVVFYVPIEIVEEAADIKLQQPDDTENEEGEGSGSGSVSIVPTSNAESLLMTASAEDESLFILSDPITVRSCNVGRMRSGLPPVFEMSASYLWDNHLLQHVPPSKPTEPRPLSTARNRVHCFI